MSRVKAEAKTDAGENGDRRSDAHQKRAASIFAKALDDLGIDGETRGKLAGLLMGQARFARMHQPPVLDMEQQRKMEGIPADEVRAMSAAAYLRAGFDVLGVDRDGIRKIADALRELGSGKHEDWKVLYVHDEEKERHPDQARSALRERLREREDWLVVAAGESVSRSLPPSVNKHVPRLLEEIEELRKCLAM